MKRIFRIAIAALMAFSLILTQYLCVSGTVITKGDLSVEEWIAAAESLNMDDYVSGSEEFLRALKNLKNAKYAKDTNPIDSHCDCPVCRRYSRAYIRHLFVAEEMLAMRLCVMHNLYFYNKLMEKIRDSLDNGTFAAFRNEYSEKLSRRI